MPRQAPARMARTLALLVTIVMLATAALAIGGPAAARSSAGPLLRLHRGTFDAATAAALQAAPGLAAATPGAALIQFSGPIGADERSALEATGVALLEYIPDYAYLVQGSEAQLAAAAALPGVYARAPFLVADKLAPTLLSALSQGSLHQPVDVSVQPWPGQAGSVADTVARLGIAPGQPLAAAQILALAAAPEVRWIEPALAPRLLNDRARQIMHVDSAWTDHGLYGAGQIVAVADSGLDTGDPETISPDFAGRIVATQVLSAGGTLADEFGHGTHVTGSLAGAGVRSGADRATHSYDGSFAGVAPEASLVIQAFEVDASGQIIGLGDDPYPILAQAYASGARIHSDSWGGPTGLLIVDPEGYFGGYTNPSRRMDEFIWDQPDMAVFVAAGNSGNDGDFFGAGCLPNGDGWIDDDSLNAPGTAKNVITVGASESVRLEGNLNTLTWNQFPPLPPFSCFARDPVASDLLSDNASGMAAFSSRGPVDDGRVKPDLVAPGTMIVSNRSSHPAASDLWGKYTPNPNYTIAGGTSMATPLAAGTGTLVREWLGRQGAPDPSAAAIKAVLLSTTADMAPGQYVVGGRQEIPALRPNSVSGWGRADLGFVSNPAPYWLWLDDHRAGLATGQSVGYAHSAAQPLTVIDSSQPLRITLAWSDPPASLSASRQLVNDLDLVVTGPDGQEYWGNQAAGGDRINNVEGVIIQVPQTGAYRVDVRAHNIPIGRQPYALVVAGAIASTPLNLVSREGLTLAEGDQASVAPEALRVTGALPENITYTLTSVPLHGGLALGGLGLGVGQSFTQADVDAGRLSYTHDGGETTSDSFAFIAGDAGGHSLPMAGFGITVTPVNDPPQAVADRAETVRDAPVTVDVLANDRDAEGDHLAVTQVGTPSVGSATSDGTQITYTPPPGFVGEATLAYTVSDGNGGSAVGSLVIGVRGSPGTPGGAPSAWLFLPAIRR